MEVTVRYFAALRETTGREGEMLTLPGGSDVAAARTALERRYPALAPVLARCAAAINRSYVPGDTTLAEGDELAFIPPLGGG
jgi:molybdopterin converting factor subunit 1